MHIEGSRKTSQTLQLLSFISCGFYNNKTFRGGYKKLVQLQSKLPPPELNWYVMLCYMHFTNCTCITFQHKFEAATPPVVSVVVLCDQRVQKQYDYDYGILPRENMPCPEVVGTMVYIYIYEPENDYHAMGRGGLCRYYSSTWTLWDIP